MKSRLSLTLTVLALFVLGAGRAFSEEGDPFESGAIEETEDPEIFKTIGGFVVVKGDPKKGRNPESVAEQDWPKIKAPTNFNEHFDKAHRVWKVDGGYFGSFGGGEWGAALFFAAIGDNQWTRVLEAHIQDVERFEGDTFLATGGLAHLSLASGAAFLVTRKSTGEFVARKVFSSELGIPRVVGIGLQDKFPAEGTKKLIVLGLKHPLSLKPFFGVDSSGETHYLGEKAESK